MDDKNSKLLNLYFDGELPQSQTEQFKKEVLSENKEDYSKMLKLRSELRTHFDKSADFSQARSEQLWARIENEISKPVEKKPWFFIPVQGYALAALCSVFAFFFGSQVYQLPSSNNRVASLSAERTNIEKQDIIASLPVEFDTQQLIGFNNVNAETNKTVSMRAGGLDIDWMESDRNYKLVKSRLDSKVPVIWVSE